jgi:hypothetical protein
MARRALAGARHTSAHTAYCKHWWPFSFAELQRRMLLKSGGLTSVARTSATPVYLTQKCKMNCIIKDGVERRGQLRKN